MSTGQNVGLVAFELGARGVAEYTTYSSIAIEGVSPKDYTQFVSPSWLSVTIYLPTLQGPLLRWPELQLDTICQESIALSP